MKPKRLALPSSLIFALAAGAAQAAPDPLASFQQIVVIYQENHSFDNLYGGWGAVGGKAVDGLPQAKAAQTRQLRQDGKPFKCLLQNDVNLTSPTPLAATCSDEVVTKGKAFASHFANKPFRIDDFIAATDATCPPTNLYAANGVAKGSPGATAGGCTRDIVHRFYQEIYQLNGGAQNRYVLGSDAVGLAMGHYDTKALPIYRYLHGAGAPHYVIADHFFQSAFGGSFLNHQWLVAAASPVFANADKSGGPDDLHSVVDLNGFPMPYPLYTPELPNGIAKAVDGVLTAKCDQPGLPKGLLCGDYAINTMQPTYQPYSPGTLPAKRLPPQSHPTIGDRLSAKGVDWAWYSGGWSNANGDVGGPGWTNGTTQGTCADPNANAKSVYPNCPDNLFQYHHQAFNYFAAYAPGTPARAAHLKDEAEFIAAAKAGTLKPFSIVKPLGEENEHPGYASEPNGNSHLVDLIKTILGGPQAASTLIIVAYDEFGGQWDHVPPPGQGGKTKGPHDQHGPGTRIPAMLISQAFTKSGVDHTSYDTTSILRTVEDRFGVAPLGTRDAAVNSLAKAVAIAK